MDSGSMRAWKAIAASRLSSFPPRPHFRIARRSEPPSRFFGDILVSESTSASAGASIDLSKALAKRWPLVLLCTLASIGLAVGYYFVAPEQYESIVEVLVMKKNAAATSVSAGGGSSDIQSEVVEDVLATQIQIFGSAQVLADAVATRSLDQLPGVAEQLDENYTAVDYLQDQLEITRGGDGQARDAQVLTARFVHGNADEAETVLGAVLESYQNFLDRTFQKASSKALGVLETAKDEIADELNAEEKAYAKFRGESGLLFAGGNSFSIDQQQLVELATQKSQLEMQRSMAKSRLNLIRRTNDEGLDAAQRLALVDSNHVDRIGLMVNVAAGDTLSEAFQAAQPERSEAANAEFDQMVSMRTERALLQAKFGTSHPRVSQLTSSIAELQGFLDKRKPTDIKPQDRLTPEEVMQAYARLLESDIEDLDRRIGEINGFIAERTLAAKKLDAVEVQDKVLNARLERKQELYNAVLAPWRDLNTMAAAQGDLITEAISPVSRSAKVWPKLPILGLIGAFLGLAGGTGLAVASELSEKTFSSPSEVSESVGLATLGVIPQIRKPADKQAVETSGIGHMVLAKHRPQSRESEAVRSIRTSLFFNDAAQGLKTLQITSPTPNDGKSLTAASLAVSLAGAGKSVLLIDADLRKPSQQVTFPGAAAAACGGEQRPHGVPRGLSDLLLDQGELPDLVVESGVENLSILFAGSLPQNPAELLTMDRADQLLQTVREQYDLVIVDTPPVLAVSDPLNVAPKVDGVVLVVPIRKNQAGAAMQAADLLRSIHSNPVGVVVNDVTGRLGSKRTAKYGYGDYGRYGSGHAYGYINDEAGYTSDAPAPAATS